MSTDLAVVHTDLAIGPGQSNWTPKQLAALEQLGVDGASHADLAVFFHQCARTGLDPFARQIYMIGRKEWDAKSQTERFRQTIQTGIDGFRLIARRAVDRAHQSLAYEDALWCGPDGAWTDVWLSADPPRASKAIVLRDGAPFSAVALWSEYAQYKRGGELTAMWKGRPAGQLAKCAEALALRKAFPQDLSGLYTDDELAHDVVDADPEPAPEPAKGVAALRTAARRKTVKADVVEAEPPPDDPPDEPAAAPPAPAEAAGVSTEQFLAMIADTADAEALRGMRRNVSRRPDASQLVDAITARLRDLP